MNHECDAECELTFIFHTNFSFFTPHDHHTHAHPPAAILILTHTRAPDRSRYVHTKSAAAACRRRGACTDARTADAAVA